MAFTEKTHLVKIPEIFHSYASQEPFRRCMSCNVNLLEKGTHYIIEKAIKQYSDYSATDTIFEYAICLKCHQEFVSSYSEKSMQNLKNYFVQNTFSDPDRIALKEKLDEGHFNLDDWLSRCLIKGTPVKNLKEYQIGCQCVGDKMIVSSMPFLIGDVAMDEISMLLSNETIDQMRGFADEFLGLPPDLRKLFKDSGVLIF